MWPNHGLLLGARFADEVDAKGQKTRVLEIPGDGAQALLPGYPALDLGEKATIALWVKPGQNLGTLMTLLSGGIERTDLWRVQLLGEGAPWQLYMEMPSGQAASDWIINEGRWFHLAISNDGSQVMTYVDGHLVAQSEARGRWLGLGAEGCAASQVTSNRCARRASSPARPAAGGRCWCTGWAPPRGATWR